MIPVSPRVYFRIVQELYHKWAYLTNMPKIRQYLFLKFSYTFYARTILEVFSKILFLFDAFYLIILNIENVNKLLIQSHSTHSFSRILKIETQFS